MVLTTATKRRRMFCVVERLCQHIVPRRCLAVSTTNLAHVQRYRRALDPSNLSQERVRFEGGVGEGQFVVCYIVNTHCPRYVRGFAADYPLERETKGFGEELCRVYILTEDICRKEACAGFCSGRFQVACSWTLSSSPHTHTFESFCSGRFQVVCSSTLSSSLPPSPNLSKLLFWKVPCSVFLNSLSSPTYPNFNGQMY